MPDEGREVKLLKMFFPHGVDNILRCTGTGAAWGANGITSGDKSYLFYPTHFPYINIYQNEL